jgi:hypothetical protein
MLSSITRRWRFEMKVKTAIKAGPEADVVASIP